MDRRPAWLDPRALLRATPFFLLLVLAAGLSYRQHVLLKDQRDRVDHTYQVIARLQTTLASLIDAETGQRGDVLTGDERATSRRTRRHANAFRPPWSHCAGTSPTAPSSGGASTTSGC